MPGPETRHLASVSGAQGETGGFQAELEGVVWDQLWMALVATYGGKKFGSYAG